MTSAVQVPNLSLALNLQATGNTCCVRSGGSPRNPKSFPRKGSENVILSGNTKLMVAKKKGQQVFVKRKKSIPFVTKHARKEQNKEAVAKCWEGFVLKNGEAFTSVIVAYAKYDFYNLYINRKALRIALIAEIDRSITVYEESKPFLEWVLREIVFVAKILKKKKSIDAQSDIDATSKGKDKGAPKKEKLREKEKKRLERFLDLCVESWSEKKIRGLGSKLLKIDPKLMDKEPKEELTLEMRLKASSLITYEKASFLIATAEKLQKLAFDEFPKLPPKESLEKYFENLEIG